MGVVARSWYFTSFALLPVSGFPPSHRPDERTTTARCAHAHFGPAGVLKLRRVLLKIASTPGFHSARIRLEQAVTTALYKSAGQDGTTVQLANSFFVEVCRAPNWQPSLLRSFFISPLSTEHKPSILASLCPQNKNTALNSHPWNLKPSKSKYQTEKGTQRHLTSKLSWEHMWHFLHSSSASILWPSDAGQLQNGHILIKSHLALSFIHLLPFQWK